jgi:hypothetical protein
MPILMLALVALAVFLAMGILLFSATISERRDRKKRLAAAGPNRPQEGEESKAKPAHA